MNLQIKDLLEMELVNCNEMLSESMRDVDLKLMPYKDCIKQKEYLKKAKVFKNKI